MRQRQSAAMFRGAAQQACHPALLCPAPRPTPPPTLPHAACWEQRKSREGGMSVQKHTPGQMQRPQVIWQCPPDSTHASKQLPASR